MEPDELLAVMAAQIYAARLSGFYATPAPKTKVEWHEHRQEIMRISVREARELWKAVTVSR